MSSKQTVVVLAGAPVCTTIATLAVRANKFVVVSSAMVAEFIVYAMLVWWSNRLLRRAFSDRRDMLLAIPQPGVGVRAKAVAILGTFAGLVGLLGWSSALLLRRG